MENVVFERIKKEIDSKDVVLFMKGNAAFPQCGFSATVVQILSLLQVPFKDIDVLSDPEIREGIKAFSNWPTIPQLYIKGEFIGGCDIIREMYESGELHAQFRDAGVEFNDAA
jgi:monothiol glutaredoxin